MLKKYYKNLWKICGFKFSGIELCFENVEKHFLVVLENFKINFLVREILKISFPVNTTISKNLKKKIWEYKFRYSLVYQKNEMIRW